LTGYTPYPRVIIPGARQVGILLRWASAQFDRRPNRIARQMVAAYIHKGQELAGPRLKTGSQIFTPLRASAPARVQFC